MDYYNDNDPGVVAWLRELIKAKLLPEGVVDERSILEVQPNDLRGYRRQHFFAGIGGWSEALRLAGWPSDAPLWTGSCPCQPFSCAGKRLGEKDERHLWPAWQRLIAECRPPIIFREQTSGRLGREWLAGVRSDLEAMDYAVGAADLCAAGVQAPHIRQRLFWVADSIGTGLERWPIKSGDKGKELQAVERAGNFWFDSRWIYYRDGKYRRVPVEPSLFPLAPRIPGRVGLLRGAGNAIVPQIAAEFVKAFDNHMRSYEHPGKILEVGTGKPWPVRA